MEKEKRLEQRRAALEEEEENERRLDEAATKVLERQKRLEEKVQEETSTVEEVKVPPVIAETLEAVRKQMETVMVDGEAEMSNKESVADLVATEYVKQMAVEAGPPGQVERQNTRGTRPGEAERHDRLPPTATSEDRIEEHEGVKIETNVASNDEIKTVGEDVTSDLKQNSGDSSETVKDLPEAEQPVDECLETAVSVKGGFLETHSVKQEESKEHATLTLIDVIETKTSEDSGLPSSPEITASLANQNVTQDELNPLRETQEHDFHVAKQTEQEENAPQAVSASGSDAIKVSDAGTESAKGKAPPTSETHPQTASAAPSVVIPLGTLTNGHIAGVSSGLSDVLEVEAKLSLAEQLASCGLPEAVDDPEFQNKLKVFSNYRSFGAMYCSKNNFKKAEWAFKNGIKQAVRPGGRWCGAS